MIGEAKLLGELDGSWTAWLVGLEFCETFRHGILGCGGCLGRDGRMWFGKE